MNTKKLAHDIILSSHHILLRSSTIQDSPCVLSMPLPFKFYEIPNRYLIDDDKKMVLFTLIIKLLLKHNVLS